MADVIVRGWLIVGGNGEGLPQHGYMGNVIGELPRAENYKVGQWFLWRPVRALVAGHPTQMAVVCIEVPLQRLEGL